MTSIFQTLPQLAQYHLTLSLLAALILLVLMQGFLLAPLAFIKEEQSPGMPLKGDPSLFSFRVIRTYQNSTESLPLILGAAFLAIIAGVSPGWVNWLVGIHFLARIAFWVAYYSGVGKHAGGIRTLTFVIGLVSNIVLAGMTLFTIAV